MLRRFCKPWNHDSITRFQSTLLIVTSNNLPSLICIKHVNISIIFKNCFCTQNYHEITFQYERNTDERMSLQQQENERET